MSRTQEQVDAIVELTAKEAAEFRKFDALADDAVGLDEISKHCCYINGWDSCKEIGVTSENGFSQYEIQNATERFVLATAKFSELI